MGYAQVGVGVYLRNPFLKGMSFFWPTAFIRWRFNNNPAQLCLCLNNQFALLLGFLESGVP
jgi:hypothetical protein